MGSCYFVNTFQGAKEVERFCFLANEQTLDILEALNKDDAEILAV